MVCGRCGREISTMKVNGTRRYTCPPKDAHGCASVSIRQDAADADVVSRVMGLRHWSDAEPVGGLYVYGKLTQLRERRNDMADAYADGKVPLDLFTRTVARLDTDIQQAEAKQAEIAEQRAAATRGRDLRWLGTRSPSMSAEAWRDYQRDRLVTYMRQRGADARSTTPTGS